MLASLVLPWYLSLGLIIVYGLVASFAFDASTRLRRSGFAMLGYLVGFLVLLQMFALSMRARGAMGLAGIANLAFMLFGMVIAVLSNGRALWTVGDALLIALTGPGAVEVRKTYDKAEAARERGDLEAAAGIYRQELEKEPQDTEARRRLAEILLEMDRTEEGVAELRALLKRLQEERPYCAAAIRLAEVLEEELGDRAGAEQVYRTVLARYPRGEYAQYARARLGEPDQ